jgi:hypothetical protein
VAARWSLSHRPWGAADRADRAWLAVSACRTTAARGNTSVVSPAATASTTVRRGRTVTNGRRSPARPRPLRRSPGRKMPGLLSHGTHENDRLQLSARALREASGEWPQHSPLNPNRSTRAAGSSYVVLAASMGRTAYWRAFAQCVGSSAIARTGHVPTSAGRPVECRADRAGHHRGGSCGKGVIG